MILMEDCCLLFDVPFSISVGSTLHRTSHIALMASLLSLAAFFCTLLVLFFTGHKISHPDNGSTVL